MSIKNQYFLHNQTFRLRAADDLNPELWFHVATNSLTCTLFASGNRIPLFNQQLKLLTTQFDHLNWPVPGFLTDPGLRDSLVGLINKNRILKGSLIKILVFPSSRSLNNQQSGLTFEYLAFITEMTVDHLPINELGLHAGIKLLKADRESQASSWCHPDINRLQMNHEARSKGLDLILLKEMNAILPQTSHGYLFSVSKNNVLAPLPVDGYRASAIAGLVPDLCRMAGLSFTALNKTTEQSLMDADELFVADDLNGFNWILALGNKRFFRKKVQVLSDILNRMLRSEDQLSIGSSG